jgi:hypothetical protein
LSESTEDEVDAGTELESTAGELIADVAVAESYTDDVVASARLADEVIVALALALAGIELG